MRLGKDTVPTDTTSLQRLSSCSLPSQEECFWELTFPTDLERSEVLIPRPLRGVWLGFTPQLQLVKILSRYLAICRPIEKMITQTRWKIGPPNLRHYSPNVIRASSSFKR